MEEIWKMKKGLIISLVCLLCLGGCGKIPVLQNGEEAVVTFAKGEEEHAISAEDLFNELKENFGLEATIKLIDTYVLEHEFSDYKEKAQDSAKAYIEAMIENYGSKEALLQEIIEYTNYTTIEGYQEYSYLSYMQTHAFEEYAKSLVTDKEIKDYYEKDVVGDIEVYHILITPDVTDDLSSDDKKKKEEEAKTKAKDVIKKLKESKNALETFKSLVKEFSEDEATKNKDGNLGFINKGDLPEQYDELIDAAYKLSDGEYSKEVITTELGYHVIYRNASKEKEKLEDIKEEIIETLANELLSTDKELTVKAMKHYRKLYNVKIIDSELNNQYGIYLNNLINNSTNNTTEE